MKSLHVLKQLLRSAELRLGNCSEDAKNLVVIEIEAIREAIQEVERLEHYTHYTCGCWATDRPDLFANQIEADLMFQLDFWDKLKEEYPKPKTFAPYVDETVEPAEAYLVFCENYSPWDEDEKNMIRVWDNGESHKLLEILEKYFGITNHHKKAITND